MLLSKVKMQHIMLLVLFISSSCESINTYQKYESIPHYNWQSSYLLNFPVEIKDTTVRYNIYINTRHTDDYPYMNLWLLVSTTLPDGRNLKKRIEIPLANSEGKWKGEETGNIWDASYMLQQNTIFDKPGNYTFTLEQNMRQDPLPGIMAMAVRIEKTEAGK